MPGPATTRRPVPSGIVAALAVAVVLILVACSVAATVPPLASPVPTSPVAIADPAASPSSAPAGSSSPTASALAASPSPSESRGPGRYSGGDDSGATPTPTAKATASPKPSPKPASLVVKSASTGLGKVLVGPNGMTLYTLSSDPRNGSGCSGSCAANWPPLTVMNGTVVKGGTGVGGTFGTFARGGKRQVTYRGRALYYFAGDAYAGDTNGQGIGGVWYVAKP